MRWGSASDGRTVDTLHIYCTVHMQKDVSCQGVSPDMVNHCHTVTYTLTRDVWTFSNRNVWAARPCNPDDSTRKCSTDRLLTTVWEREIRGSHLEPVMNIVIACAILTPELSWQWLGLFESLWTISSHHISSVTNDSYARSVLIVGHLLGISLGIRYILSSGGGASQAQQPWFLTGSYYTTCRSFGGVRRREAYLARIHNHIHKSLMNVGRREGY